MTMAHVSRSMRLRIRGGGTRGALEVNIEDGGWGAVCDDNFGPNAAQLFCRELGYESGSWFRTTHGNDNFAADRIVCSYATRVSECKSSMRPYEYKASCLDPQTVGIECSGSRIAGC